MLERRPVRDCHVGPVPSLPCADLAAGNHSDAARVDALLGRGHSPPFFNTAGQRAVSLKPISEKRLGCLCFCHLLASFCLFCCDPARDDMSLQLSALLVLGRTGGRVRDRRGKRRLFFFLLLSLSRARVFRVPLFFSSETRSSRSFASPRDQQLPSSSFSSLKNEVLRPARPPL